MKVFAFSKPSRRCRRDSEGRQLRRTLRRLFIRTNHGSTYMPIVETGRGIGCSKERRFDRRVRRQFVYDYRKDIQDDKDDLCTWKARIFLLAVASRRPLTQLDVTLSFCRRPNKPGGPGLYPRKIPTVQRSPNSDMETLMFVDYGPESIEIFLYSKDFLPVR